LPQEFHFEDTSNSARVKTVVPKELIGPDALLLHVRQMRLGAGTIIKVQVMSKKYDTVLHSADFLIQSAVETSKRIVDERGERTALLTDYRIVQETPWKSYEEVPEQVSEEPGRIPEVYVPGEGEIKWNPGKKAYDVIVGDKVWTTVVRLEGEDTEDYRARALAIAAGSLKAA